jgi:hypothetical protein
MASQGRRQHPSFGLDQPGNLYIVDFDGDMFSVEAAQP